MGLAEMALPGRLSSVLGLGSSRNRAVLRVRGMTQAATGVGLLRGSRQASWLWARLGGDAFDLAYQVFAAAWQKLSGRRATAAVRTLGATAVDVITGSLSACKSAGRAAGGRSDNGAHPQSHYGASAGARSLCSLARL